MPRFVHVGTEAALMHGEPLVDVDETAPLRPDSKALYSRTKARAEQVARQRRRAVVVRPRLVWGPGDTTILPALADAVRRKRFAWIGGGRHRTSTTHVDNVVEGLLLGATKGATGDGVLRHRRRAQVVPRVRHPPAGHAGHRGAGQVGPARRRRGALATAGEAAWRVLPLPGQPPVTRLAFWLASQECTIDISRARRELGYAPITSVDQGMEELRSA